MRKRVNPVLVVVLFLGVALPGLSLAKSKVKCDQNPLQHPLYCEILMLQPKIDHAWAMDFSNHLHTYAKKYKLDPWRSLAIAMQESSLKQKNRKVPVLIFTEKCSKNRCKRSYKIIRGISDIGLFQFHIGTVKYYKLDPLRLMDDLEYAVESHFKLLKKKIEKCKHLKSAAWSCYHSRSAMYRKKYITLVNRYYPNSKKKISINNKKQKNNSKEVLSHSLVKTKKPNNVLIKSKKVSVLGAASKMVVLPHPSENM